MKGRAKRVDMRLHCPDKRALPVPILRNQRDVLNTTLVSADEVDPAAIGQKKTFLPGEVSVATSWQSGEML